MNRNLVLFPYNNKINMQSKDLVTTFYFISRLRSPGKPFLLNYSDWIKLHYGE